MLDSEADPMEQTASIDIVVGLSKDLRRFAMELMLRSAPEVRELEVQAGPGEAIEAVLERGSGIVVLELAELGQSAVAALTGPDASGVQVLLLVDDVERADLGRVTSVRCVGILDVGNLTRRSVRDCLRQIALGEVPLPARLAQRLLTPGWAPAAERPLPRLTPREREVLPLLVDGMSNKQIARRLAISDHGAKRLVASILTKLDSPNRTCAVTRALRDGLYDQCLAAAR